MSLAAIQTAFNTKLQTFSTANSIGVAYENVDVEFAPSVSFLRAYLMPANTVASALGTSAYNRHRGVFQVDCVYIAGQGWGACAAMAELVRVAFKRGTKLDSNKITIESASVAKGIRQDGRYIIPVSINYRADYSN